MEIKIPFDLVGLLKQGITEFGGDAAMFAAVVISLALFWSGIMWLLSTFNQK